MLGSSGYSAAWLARLTGGQEVVGSNPASPTPKTYNSSSIAGSRGCFRFRSQTHTPRQPFLLASRRFTRGHSHASSDHAPRNQAPGKVPVESNCPARSLLRLPAETIPPLNQPSRTPPGPVAQADRIAPETQVPRRCSCVAMAATSSEHCRCPESDSSGCRSWPATPDQNIHNNHDQTRDKSRRNPPG